MLNILRLNQNDKAVIGLEFVEAKVNLPKDVGGSEDVGGAVRMESTSWQRPLRQPDITATIEHRGILGKGNDQAYADVMTEQAHQMLIAN